MTSLDDDGRHSQHLPRRRIGDRLPEREQAKFSEADVEHLLAAGYRRALEVRDSEPTGIQTLEDRRTLKQMTPAASWWNVTTKTLTGILLLAGVIASFWGGCVAVRTEMDHAVTLQTAPIRLDIGTIKADLRELLRRVPANASP